MMKTSRTQTGSAATSAAILTDSLRKGSSAVTPVLDQMEGLMEQLKAEREQLVARLARVDKILGIEHSDKLVRPDNEVPLKDVLAKILTEQGPMTKPELLDVVMKSDYKFMTDDPMNSINVVLYTRKNGFRKLDGGKFAAPVPAGKAK